MAGKKVVFSRKPKKTEDAEPIKITDDLINEWVSQGSEDHEETSVVVFPGMFPGDSSGGCLEIAKPKHKRMIVEVSPEFHKALKSYCAQNSTTISKKIRELLSQEIGWKKPTV